MKNAKFLLAALAIALVFGMTSCGKKDSTDPALNGTWNISGSSKAVLDNGSYTAYDNDILVQKGSFTTSGNKITITPTQIYMGADTAAYLSETLGITIAGDKFYSKSEALALPVPAAFKDAWTEEVNDMFKPQKGTYSVDGNTLTLTDEDGHVETWTK